MLIPTAPGKIPGYTANNSSNGATTLRDIPDTQAGRNEPMDPKKINQPHQAVISSSA
jgi:hypothetical protein